MLGRQASVGTPQASPAHCSTCGRQSLKAAPRPSVAPSAQSNVLRKGDATFKVCTDTTKLRVDVEVDVLLVPVLSTISYQEKSIGVVQISIVPIEVQSKPI